MHSTRRARHKDVPSDSSGNGPPFLWILSFRLHGCRRYDSTDGGGRIASGTAIESNAGAVAEAEHKFAWSEFEQPIRLARRAKTREGFRNEKYLALGGETPIQSAFALATP